MNHVHFEPWIGNNYWDGGCFGKRILILGESHYGNDYGSSLTQDILSEQAYSDCTRATFTKFERALEGSDTDCDDRERIWNSVAFYNYVQECLPDARISPTDEQFEESEDAFFEVLDYLEPDVVLVWGSRLWDSMPSANYECGDDCEYDGCSYSSGTYTTPSGLEVPCYEMQHPSTGFSWEWWHGFLTSNYIL